MTREELKKFEPLWDKWYVQEHLGGGSYGDVYRITCQVYERTYEAALKVIYIPKDQSELNEVELNCETKEETISYYDRMRQSITAEIDMMEQLKGRTNIVSFEDHDIVPHNRGKDPGYDIFIRMELLEDFSSSIGRESKQWTDNQQVVKLGMDIAEGLRVCHSHNIIHRDIKLGNIFRSKDGDYKIGDFGIARNVSDAQLTMSIKGTFNYMAPEVYNREHYDFRADIYSLGMVLYHLLNKNRGPFLPLTEVPTAEQKETALIRRMRGDRMRAPLLAGQKLGEIILKACEYRKEDRFQSMEEFYRALLMLSKEDMERPDNPLFGKESSDALQQKEALPEEQLTVAFVESQANQGGGNPQMKASELPEAEEEDDRTVAMDMTGMVANREAVSAIPRPAAAKVQVADQPSDTKKQPKKGLYLGIAGVVLAVAAICVVVGVSGAMSKRPAETDEIVQEELPEVTEVVQEELPDAPEEEVADQNEVQEPEVTGPVAPFCSKEVAVKGGKESGGLIFEGDRLDDLKIKGEFQASETDDTKVEGSLVLEHSEEFINESGEYTWKFTPDDAEHFEAVTGTVHVTAIHKELINGLDELKQIEDPAAVYQLSLAGCGLKDLSVLKDMTNLVVLVVSDNDLTDISELAEHPKLQQVYLDGNAGLKDVQALFSLEKLSIAELSGTAVSDEDRSKLEKQLAE